MTNLLRQTQKYNKIDKSNLTSHNKLSLRKYLDELFINKSINKISIYCQKKKIEKRIELGTFTLIDNLLNFGCVKISNSKHSC